jgi:hypothetical protein
MLKPNSVVALTPLTATGAKMGSKITLNDSFAKKTVKSL